jgi:branched-chain amino acid transport system substrate-binding protein
MRLRRCRCTVLLTLTLLVHAFSAAFSQTAKGPIKIGFQTSYVGVYAKAGKDMDGGFRIALDEAGYKAAGRPVVLIPEDDEAKPELGPTKARKLIEYEKVHIIAGISHSGVALAIRDIVDSSKTPLVITVAGERSVTGKLKSPYIFRTSFANGQHDGIGGWYAYHRLGYRRMMVVAWDYSAGREKAETFMKAFKAEGGQIVDEVYVPLSASDFAPYMTKIAGQAKNIDAVWAFISSGGSIRFINQYAEYGLKQTVPLFPIGDTVDDGFLASMGDNAAGIRNYQQYAVTLDNPENKKFVQAFYAKYKEYPTYFAETSYVAGKAILSALEAVKGDIENKKDAFLAALRKTEFAAPHGRFRFDSDQNVILPIYIREVRKVEGRYTNVVVETIADNVDQNWTAAKMKR